MITCRRAAEWTSRELDERLPAGRQFALGFHRLLCGPCRQFRDQLSEIDRAVGEAITAGEVAAEPLSDEARERMRQALENDSAS